MRVTEYFNKLSRETVKSPLEIFRALLDTFLCSLFYGMHFSTVWTR